jgi:hypothetical protein
LFYFSPFDLHNPADNLTLTNSHPTFEFSVNKQRSNLRDNLSKYQIRVRRGGNDSTANWETLIDDIPIDFRSVKNNSDNLQRGGYGDLDTNNGIYETDKFHASYSDESSRIRVYSKVNLMSGKYQWKVVAIDKSGHEQEAGTRNIHVNSTSMGIMTSNFPLAVLNISGLGNPGLNTYNLTGLKNTYRTFSINPVFYGIAWTNSKVTLKLTDESCTTDCTKTYPTVANPDSRFGINVPKGDLTYGKKYTANLSVTFEDKYNELPQFTLAIFSHNSDKAEDSKANILKDQGTEPIPTPQTVESSEEIQQQPTPKKKCFLFLCF